MPRSPLPLSFSTKLSNTKGFHPRPGPDSTFGNLEEHRDHMEMTNLGEGSGLATGDVVDIETTVVDELALGTTVADLGNALVLALLVLEEHDSSPVVGEILNEGARRASGLGDEVVLDGVHGDVERVATHNLVKMGGVEHAGVDDRVDTIDNELRAGKPKHGLAGNILREDRGRGGDGEVLHCGGCCSLFLLNS